MEEEPYKKQKIDSGDPLEDPTTWGNYTSFEDWYNWIPKNGHWTLVEEQTIFPYSKKITVTYSKIVYDIKVIVIKTIEVMGTGLFNSSSKRIIEYISSNRV